MERLRKQIPMRCTGTPEKPCKYEYTIAVFDIPEYETCPICGKFASIECFKKGGKP